MRIAYTKPSITQLEIDYATDAAANGWGERCYEYIVRFETEFASYIGSKYAIATSSCTGAMTLGLHALGVGAGDEVILADTNWIATASPIVHAGAQPVFVDILPDTWCIDPQKVEKAITSRTKAVIATHLYGNLCDLATLKDICDRNGLFLIEDAAEAIGSSYAGRKAGATGIFSTFSFHGTKTLTTGEGGVLLTNDEALYEYALTLSNHGRSRSQKKQFWAEVNGFKFKMSNIQAAIGCAQLQRINQLVERKREIFYSYVYELKDYSDFIKLNPEKPGSQNGFWMPNVVVDQSLGVSQDDLKRALNEKDIDARVFFWPLSSLPMYEEVKSNIHSYDIPTRAVNLPSFHEMNTGMIKEITTTIIDVLKEHIDAKR